MNDIALIEAAIECHFSDVTKPLEGVYRATKRREDQVYQVHYFDATQQVLADKFDFHTYQRTLLLEDFYSVEGALQWNFYLHFIIDDQKLDLLELERIRHRIENDKKLARKYIVSYKEFNQYLNPVGNEGVENTVDLIDQWADLFEADLGDVLDEKVPLTNVIKSYMHSSQHKKSFRKTRRTEVHPFLPIQNLDLIKYRRFPLLRSFDFGMVNLISGPNAVGKTSLLEALELVVCGKTMRNPDSIEDFTFRMKPYGGVAKEVTREDEIEYRSRDHYWYGRNNYVRGNELHNSFSRFNFFDADAAVRFSERVDEGGGTNKTLTQIVFGPDADKIYERIGKLKDLFETNKRSVTKSLKEEKETQKRINIELDSKMKADAEQPSQEIIKDSLKNYNIILSSFENHHLENFLQLLGHTSIYISSWKSANQRFDVSSFASFELVLADLKQVVQKVVALESAITQLANRIDHAKDSKRNLEQEVKLLERLKEYKVSGAIDINNIKRDIAPIKNEIDSFEKVIRYYRLFDQTSLEPELSISEAKAKCKAAFGKVKEAEDLNAQFLAHYRAITSEVEMLIKEVRSKGREIVKNLPDIDECPLCGTDFKPEKLADKIGSKEGITYLKGSVDEYVNTADILAEQKRSIEYQRKNISVLEEAVHELKSPALFKSPIKTIMIELDGLTEILSDCHRRYSLLKQKLDQNANDGYSSEELNHLIEQLGIKHDFTQFLEKGLDGHIAFTKQLMSSQEEDVLDLTEEIQLKRKESEIIKSTHPVFVGLDIKSITNLPHELEELLSDVKNLSSMFILKPEDTVSSVEARAVQAKELISRYLVSLAEQKSLQELKNKLELSNTSIKHSTELLKKIDSGLLILTKTTKEKSPEVFLTQFLEKYSELISGIFTQIHSPKEFEGVFICDKELFVKRRISGEKAQLSELSTGQRTALVLSVFLAMNRLMKNGPPLLIFDDPVTYVDDLNILSFLDYLQRLSLEETRQIFFATANERISSIFNKKFEFIKSKPNGFKDFRLSRGGKTNMHTAI